MDVEKFLPFDALCLEDDEFMKLLDDLVDFNNFDQSNNNEKVEIDPITADEKLVPLSEPTNYIPAPNNILSRKPNNGNLSLNFIHELSKAINKNDLRSVSQVIYDAMHSKCIFRIFDPSSRHKIELFGVDSVIGYFDSFLSAFPDGVCVLRKVKSTDERIIRKTKSKICFAGTKVSNYSTKSNKYDAMFTMSSYPDELCEHKQFVQKLEQQNILVQFFLKVGINTIIDRHLNQIIVCELQAKISSCVPSTASES